MYFRSLLLMAVAPIAVLGAIKRATPSTFELYAYGDDVGGIPVFFADGEIPPFPSPKTVLTHLGYAYVGSPQLSNSSDAAEVVCMCIIHDKSTNMLISNSLSWRQ